MKRINFYHPGFILPNSQYYMAEYLYSIIRTSNTFNVYSNIDEVKQILTIKKNQCDIVTGKQIGRAHV